jgi:hypothetical protein
MCLRACDGNVNFGFGVGGLNFLCKLPQRHVGGVLRRGEPYSNAQYATVRRLQLRGGAQREWKMRLHRDES